MVCPSVWLTLIARYNAMTVYTRTRLNTYTAKLALLFSIVLYYFLCNVLPRNAL